MKYLMIICLGILALNPSFAIGGKKHRKAEPFVTTSIQPEPQVRQKVVTENLSESDLTLGKQYVLSYLNLHPDADLSTCSIFTIQHVEGRYHSEVPSGSFLKRWLNSNQVQYLNLRQNMGGAWVEIGKTSPASTYSDPSCEHAWEYGALQLKELGLQLYGGVFNSDMPWACGGLNWQIERYLRVHTEIKREDILVLSFSHTNPQTILNFERQQTLKYHGPWDDNGNQEDLELLRDVISHGGPGCFFENFPAPSTVIPGSYSYDVVEVECGVKAKKYYMEK